MLRAFFAFALILFLTISIAPVCAQEETQSEKDAKIRERLIGRWSNLVNYYDFRDDGTYSYLSGEPSNFRVENGQLVSDGRTLFDVEFDEDGKLWLKWSGNREGFTNDGEEKLLFALKEISAQHFRDKEQIGHPIYGVSVKLADDDKLRYLATMATEARGLRLLHLNGTFSGEGLFWLPPLSKIVELNIFQKEPVITDDDLGKLAAWNEQLTTLSLRGTAVIGTSLGNFKSLKQLSLGPAVFPDEIERDAGMEAIGRLKQLEKLDLDMANVTDVGMKHLAGCEALTELDVTRNKLTAAGFQALEENRKLTKITVGVYAGDAEVKAIARLKQLEELELRHTDVTDRGLEVLKDLNNLRSLVLIGGKVTEAGVEACQRLLPNCKVEYRKN